MLMRALVVVRDRENEVAMLSLGEAIPESCIARLAVVMRLSRELAGGVRVLLLMR